MSLRRLRLPRRRPRPNAILPAKQSTSSPATCRARAEGRSPNASASTAAATSRTPNISWSGGRTLMPRAAAITASRRVHSATASTPSSARGTTIMTTTAAIFRRRGTCGGRRQYYGQYGPYGRDPRYQAQPPRDPYGREYQTPQRIDPGYIWGNRRYY